MASPVTPPRLASIVPYLRMLASPAYQSSLVGGRLTVAQWQLLVQDIAWVDQEYEVHRAIMGVVHSVERMVGVPLLDYPVELYASIVAVFCSPANWGTASYIISQEHRQTVSQVRAAQTADPDTSAPRLVPPSPEVIYAWIWHVVGTADYLAHTDLIARVVRAVLGREPLPSPERAS